MIEWVFCKGNLPREYVSGLAMVILLQIENSLLPVSWGLEWGGTYDHLFLSMGKEGIEPDTERSDWPFSLQDQFES